MSFIESIYLQVYKIKKRLDMVKTEIGCNCVKIWCSGFLSYPPCIEETEGQDFKFCSQ